MKLTDSVLKYDVLKLNKNWQVIGIVSVRDAIDSMFGESVTALNCEDGLMIPCRIKDWLDLPVRPQDDYINTVTKKIRAPRVIITIKFDKLIVRPPKLNLKNLRRRDKDTCIYTGKKLKESEMSIEHVEPVSKGGKTVWDNVALAHRDINSKRSNKPLDEIGLKLRYKPYTPRPVNPSELIENTMQYPEWSMFIKT